MSATNRGAERQPDDFYETPAWATEELLKTGFTAHIANLHNRRARVTVVDPFAGRGAILDVCAGHAGLRTRGIELDHKRAAFAIASGHVVKPGDSLQGPHLLRIGRSEVVITNPPYSLALEAVQTFLVQGAGQRFGAFLLRVNWLGSTRRREFHRKYPADLYVLSKRPEFATFLKCKGIPTAPKGAARAGCGWRAVEPPGTPAPPACPQCGGDVQVSRSDATEYAWWVWGPGLGGRYWII